VLEAVSFEGYDLDTADCGTDTSVSFGLQGNADEPILGFTVQIGSLGPDAFVFDVATPDEGFTVQGFFCALAAEVAGTTANVGVIDAAGRRSGTLPVNLPRGTDP
jgi:hypothetical protein